MAHNLRLLVVLAAVVVALVWGFRVLTADLYMELPRSEETFFCGSVYDVALNGGYQMGGEVPYDELSPACTKQAREDAREAIAPGILGLLGVGYLFARGGRVVRQAKDEGRSTGASTG